MPLVEILSQDEHRDAILEHLEDAENVTITNDFVVGGSSTFVGVTSSGIDADDVTQGVSNIFLTTGAQTINCSKTMANQFNIQNAVVSNTSTLTINENSNITLLGSAFNTIIDTSSNNLEIDCGNEVIL